MSAPPETRRQANPVQFVQTDRSTHEAWAILSARKPMAAAVMHYLAARLGEHNAVVTSQKAIADVIGVSDRTIRTALHDLEAGHWIQIVKIGAGRECAYVVNSTVAWSEKRENLRFAVFSATVIADARDQSEMTLSERALWRIPKLGRAEVQLPSGAGLPPKSQPFFDGMEPDLPASILPDEGPVS